MLRNYDFYIRMYIRAGAPDESARRGSLACRMRQLVAVSADARDARCIQDSRARYQEACSGVQQKLIQPPPLAPAGTPPASLPLPLVCPPALPPNARSVEPTRSCVLLPLAFRLALRQLLCSTLPARSLPTRPLNLAVHPAATPRPPPLESGLPGCP